mgnify:CR=1 FL=1
MNELKQLLNELSGEGKTLINTTIAISENKEGIILKSDPNIFEMDLFDGELLSDNVENFEKLNLSPGIYECIIEIKTWISGDFDNGREWDMGINIKDTKLIWKIE